MSRVWNSLSGLSRQRLQEAQTYLAFSILCLVGALLIAALPLTSLRLVPGLALLVMAIIYWRRLDESESASLRAAQGARGEEQIASLLEPMASEWSVYRNIFVEGLGDIDFVVVSPHDRCFTIDVKSHGGSVIWNGRCLLRRKSGVEFFFEKDFFWPCRRQALAVRKALNSGSVVPLLVFSSADVLIESDEQEAIWRSRHVWVLAAQDLLQFLQDYGRPGRSLPKYTLAQISKSNTAVTENFSSYSPGVEDESTWLQEVWCKLEYCGGGCRSSGGNEGREEGGSHACSCIEELTALELESVKQQMKKIGQVAAVSQMNCIHSSYRVRLRNCWWCKEDLLVFDWPGRGAEDCEPPRPRPRSVRKSQSKSGRAFRSENSKETERGSSWENSCTNCLRCQGDYYVYHLESSYYWFNLPDQSA